MPAETKASRIGERATERAAPQSRRGSVREPPPRCTFTDSGAYQCIHAPSHVPAPPHRVEDPSAPYRLRVVPIAAQSGVAPAPALANHARPRTSSPPSAQPPSATPIAEVPQDLPPPLTDGAGHPVIRSERGRGRVWVHRVAPITRGALCVLALFELADDVSEDGVGTPGARPRRRFTEARMAELPVEEPFDPPADPPPPNLRNGGAAP